MRVRPASVLITGASSGIGEALAKVYAGPGVALALTGRDPARLGAAAKACRELGASVATSTIDVTEAKLLAAWIAEIDRATPIDLVIANAGISAGTGGVGESEEQARRIMAVNVGGVFNTVSPILPAMRARGSGQIAIMSSLASFRGFPGAPAYCASKAAVRVWGEAQRGELRTFGVGVSVICPGYVVSRMTERNDFPMPMLMSAERAAAIIMRGIAKNRARIAFPWPIYALVRAVAALPPGLIDPLLTRLPRKRGG